MAGWTYSWDVFYDEKQQAADAARALASVPGNKKVALRKQLKSSGFRAKSAFLADASEGDSWWQSLGSLAQDTLSEGY